MAVKKAKHMAANRASAAKSRERQQQVTRDLEARLTEMQQEMAGYRRRAELAEARLAIASAKPEVAGVDDDAVGAEPEVVEAGNGGTQSGMKRRRDDAEEEEQRPAKCCCRTVL